MAAKKDQPDSAETRAATTTTTKTADVPTGHQEVRRGLGAPPPGTTGDPTVKPIDPGETG